MVWIWLSLGRLDIPHQHKGYVAQWWLCLMIQLKLYLQNTAELVVFCTQPLSLPSKRSGILCVKLGTQNVYFFFHLLSSSICQMQTTPPPPSLRCWEKIQFSPVCSALRLCCDRQCWKAHVEINNSASEPGMSGVQEMRHETTHWMMRRQQGSK